MLHEQSFYGESTFIEIKEKLLQSGIFENTLAALERNGKSIYDSSGNLVYYSEEGAGLLGLSDEKEKQQEVTLLEKVIRQTRLAVFLGEEYNRTQIDKTYMVDTTSLLNGMLLYDSGKISVSRAKKFGGKMKDSAQILSGSTIPEIDHYESSENTSSIADMIYASNLVRKAGCSAAVINIVDSHMVGVGYPFSAMDAAQTIAAIANYRTLPDGFVSIKDRAANVISRRPQDAEKVSKISTWAIQQEKTLFNFINVYREEHGLVVMFPEDICEGFPEPLKFERDLYDLYMVGKK